MENFFNRFFGLAEYDTAKRQQKEDRFLGTALVICALCLTLLFIVSVNAL